jgi:hypothetical protein
MRGARLVPVAPFLLAWFACSGRTSDGVASPGSGPAVFPCAASARTEPGGRPRLPQQGLTLTSANRSAGLAGAYRRGADVVFFRARRQGVNEEWVIEVLIDPLRRHSNTPKYSVPMEVLDRNCQNIFSSWGFSDGSVAPYADKPEDVATHQADIRLVGEAMLAVAASPRAAALPPELEPLKQLGSMFRRSGGVGATFLVGAGGPALRGPGQDGGLTGPIDPAGAILIGARPVGSAPDAGTLSLGPR